MSSPFLDPQQLIQSGGLIPLPDTLSALRAQLEEAHLRQIERVAQIEASGGTTISFTIDEVTVNFEVVVTNSVGTSGKISYWVASAEAQGKLDRSARHSVSIKLKISKSADGHELTFGHLSSQNND